MNNNENPIDAFPAGRSIMLDTFRTEALATWTTSELQSKLAALESFRIAPAGSVIDLQKKALRSVLSAR